MPDWRIGLVVAAALGAWLYAERGALLRPSTWRMVKLSGWRRFLNLTTLHGYLYARFSNLYVLIGSQWIVPRMGERGRRWLATHYHGKVLPTPLAQSLITIREDIPLRDLEQIIPFPMARDLVLAGPPDIALFECPCRAMRENPCTPTQVCMVVGQPFVDFVLEHNPKTSRRVSPEEAVALLQAERERGHIHTAWFKDAAVERFYGICNCCQCCCGGLEAMVNHGVPMVISSGYVAHIDAERCRGCGRCARACAFGALSQPDARGSVAVLDWAACMGCGACEALCPHDAVTLVRDAAKGIPLDVRALRGDSPTLESARPPLAK